MSLNSEQGDVIELVHKEFYDAEDRPLAKPVPVKPASRLRTVAVWALLGFAALMVLLVALVVFVAIF